MAAPSRTETAQELANRVLRRAQVSKMTRALQDRLALANIKVKKGWQNRSIDSLEPELEKELKRKRADSAADIFSDTSSNVSGNCFSSGVPASSPLTGPIFSDDLPRSGSSQGSVKRTKVAGQSRTRTRTDFHILTKSNNANSGTTSWKTAYQLPQSSPIPHVATSRPSVAELHRASFVSETSTILDSASASEDDDQDLPLHSFQFTTNDIPSSPPRTPPPDVARSARLRSRAFSSPVADSKGADLLLYLAQSPSPAMRANKSTINQPSTPPAKGTPLPSSMMSTPGGQTYVAFGPTTPSTAFNFADYVNITPSPAQGSWARTPAASKTPLAAREARKRLNYDALMPPPGVSPNLTRSASRRDAGLGMELGGEIAR